MRSPPLIFAATLAAAASISSADAAPDAARRNPESLLAGPARCVLRYLEAVRRAGPRPAAPAGRLPAAREADYGPVKELTAPRTLEEIGRLAATGRDHPLAPWQQAARARVLESFQLLAVRRAPLGAAIVTVAESFWTSPRGSLERGVAEYLVGRVGRRWLVIDRSPGRPFDDASLPERYRGFFDP